MQNIRKFCEMRGVKPTVACRDSGAGKSLISQIATRGVVPSVEKVQLLAGYLGVTTSKLLGEAPRAVLAQEIGLDVEKFAEILGVSVNSLLNGEVDLGKSVLNQELPDSAREVAEAYASASPELQGAVRRVLGLRP